MNQDQKKYLLKRIDDIRDQKKNELRTSVTSINILPFLDKLQVNKNVFQIGKVTTKLRKELLSQKKLPDDNEYNAYISFSESEFFSNYQEIKARYDESVKGVRTLIQNKEAELNTYVTNLRDEIMLGDSRKALEQLAKFEKMKF